MKVSTGLVLFLLLIPAPAPAQNAAPSLAALVRINCTRGGEPVPFGSGFVIAIEGDLATIITASHVVEGAQCEVEFTVSVDRVPVERVLGIEAGEDHGVAALRVRGVPAGVAVLARAGCRGSSRSR